MRMTPFTPNFVAGLQSPLDSASDRLALLETLTKKTLSFLEATQAQNQPNKLVSLASFE